MEAVSNVNYNHSYINENRSNGANDKSNVSFDIEKINTSDDDERLLGIGFLKAPNNNIYYGMRAEYAENFSAENPIISVKVQKEYGEVEEYNIDISKVNPQNATEIEMFALCNYADATRNGTGGTFGSWQTLNYYRQNASHNGYFEMTNIMEQFKNIKQNWTSMVSAMINDYINAGLFKQALDGKQLLGAVNRFLSQ